MSRPTGLAHVYIPAGRQLCVGNIESWRLLQESLASVRIAWALFDLENDEAALRCLKAVALLNGVGRWVP